MDPKIVSLLINDKDTHKRGPPPIYGNSHLRMEEVKRKELKELESLGDVKTGEAGYND